MATYWADVIDCANYIVAKPEAKIMVYGLRQIQSADELQTFFADVTAELYKLYARARADLLARRAEPVTPPPAPANGDWPHNLGEPL